MGLPRSCTCGAIHQHGERCPVAKARYEQSRQFVRPSFSERYGKGWAKISAKVIARDGGVCQLQLPGCTQIAKTADHILPRARGGSNVPTNLRAACLHCNVVRGNKERAKNR